MTITEDPSLHAPKTSYARFCHSKVNKSPLLFLLGRQSQFLSSLRACVPKTFFALLGTPFFVRPFGNLKALAEERGARGACYKSKLALRPWVQSTETMSEDLKRRCGPNQKNLVVFAVCLLSSIASAAPRWNKQGENYDLRFKLVLLICCAHFMACVRGSLVPKKFLPCYFLFPDMKGDRRKENFSGW